MVDSPDRPPRPRKRAPTVVESVLLVVGLTGLAFAAGAGGWVIGRETAPSEVRTVTIAGTPPPATTEVTTTIAGAPPPATTELTTTGAEAAPGDAVAGKSVFVSTGCGSCHTLKAAGASGTVGPNLDEKKLSISEIIDWVTNGKGGMPSYRDQLSRQQIEDVAAFIAGSTAGL